MTSFLSKPSLPQKECEHEHKNPISLELLRQSIHKLYELRFGSVLFTELLTILFNKYDSNNTDFLNAEEFTKFVRSVYPSASKENCELLISQYDKNHSGGIGRSEFLECMLTPLSPKRQAIVLSKFGELVNNDGNVMININDLDFSGHKNAMKISDIRKRNAYNQYSSSTLVYTIGNDVVFSYNTDTSKPSHNKMTVKNTEFIGYYTFMSNNTERDSDFEKLIVRDWDKVVNKHKVSRTCCH